MTDSPFVVLIIALAVLGSATLAAADDWIFQNRSAQVSLFSQKIHEGWEIDAFGGAAFRSYNLGSDSGFNASLPSSLGYTAGVEGLYHSMNSALQWLASFQHQGTSFSNIPSVSPSSITTSDNLLTLAALFQPWQSISPLQLGLGLSLNSVSVPQTLPGAVETSFIQMGPSFLARYTDSFSGWLNYRIGLGLTTPFYMRELYQDTGSRSLALDYALSAELTTPVTDKVDLGIRFYAYLLTTDYQGSGQRDSGNPTINGTEGLWLYGVPVEIRIRF